MGRRAVATAIVLTVSFTLVTLESSLSAPPEKYTISVEALGVTFELPKGYAVLQRQYGAPYFTSFDFGKELRPGHLKDTGLMLGFSPMAHDSSGDYVPSKYVDQLFKWAKGNFQGFVRCCKQGPEYILLFGNKAVRYSFVSRGTEITQIVGYLRGDQLSSKSAARQHPEYSVRITYDFAKGQSDKQLLDTLTSTLRIIR